LADAAGFSGTSAAHDRGGTKCGVQRRSSSGGWLWKCRGTMVMHSRHYAYVMLLSVFVLGGLTGAAATYGVAQMKLARLVSEDRSEMRELRRLNALTRELGLNERQRQSVRQIVDGYRDERERRVRKM